MLICSLIYTHLRKKLTLFTHTIIIFYFLLRIFILTIKKYNMDITLVTDFLRHCLVYMGLLSIWLIYWVVTVCNYALWTIFIWIYNIQHTLRINIDKYQYTGFANLRENILLVSFSYCVKLHHCCLDFFYFLLVLMVGGVDGGKGTQCPPSWGCRTIGLVPVFGLWHDLK